MNVTGVAAATLLVSAFVLLDGFLRGRLYRGEPTNPNFRLGYRIDQFRGKWEVRIGLVLAGSAAIVLVVAAFVRLL